MPYGPLTQARLQSGDELEILEALMRIHTDLSAEDRRIPALREILLALQKNPHHLATRTLATLNATQSIDDAKLIIEDERQDLIVRIATSIMLLESKPPGSPYLASILEDRQHSLQVRWAVLIALLFSPENWNHFDGGLLVRLARDPQQEPIIRRLALAGLGYQQQLPGGAVDVLLEALRSNEGERMLAAAEAFTRLTKKDGVIAQDRRAEVHAALADLAFQEALSLELRQVALEAIVEVDLVAGMRERALRLFHDRQAHESLRHQAALVVIQTDAEDASHADAHLAVLRDAEASARLRDDALQLLDKSDKKAPAFLQAMQASLSSLGPMLTRGQETDAHRILLISLLQSLAPQVDLTQLLPALQRMARDPQEEGELRQLALGMLVRLADGSRPTALFLESMVKDPAVEPEWRSIIIEMLSRTAKAYLPGPLLMDLLQERSTPEPVRRAVIAALGSLGTEARPFVDDLLRLARAEQALWFKRSVLLALDRSRSFTPELASLTADVLLFTPAPGATDDASMSSGAYAEVFPVLRTLGVHAQGFLPRLIQALDAPHRSNEQKQHLIQAIAIIAASMSDAREVSSLETLETALQRMETLGLEGTQQSQAEVRRAIRDLRNEWLRGAIHGVRTFLVEKWALTAALLYLLLGLATGLLLLRFSPLLIHRLDTWAQRLPEIRLPEALGGHTLSPRALLIITMFRHHPRVIDAWVKSVLPTVRHQFSEKKAVHLRQLYIPLPLEVEGRVAAEPGPEVLRDITRRKRFFMAVEGEGGAGKSSAAFQLARWGMAKEPRERLTDFPMIPILLDCDLPQKPHAVLSAIGAELMALTRAQEPLAEPFLRELLARQRLLVIADRVSELSAQTREQLISAVIELPISAFVLTSRREELWPGVSKTPLRPIRISGNNVSQFLDAYLTRRGVRALFQDEHFFEICRGLSALVRERDITPLLAQMYAEYALARRKADPGAASPSEPPVGPAVPAALEPKSVPELISCYVDQISGSVRGPFAQYTVHDILQTIAWECVRDGFRPGSAPLDRVLTGLKDQAHEKLTFAVERLGIVQLTGLGRDQVRFALDPVAEYLAAILMLQTNGKSEKQWTAELNRLGTLLEKEPVHAFVQVLADCSQTELGKGIPPPVLQRILGMVAPPASHPPVRASA